MYESSDENLNFKGLAVMMQRFSSKRDLFVSLKESDQQKTAKNLVTNDFCRLSAIPREMSLLSIIFVDVSAKMRRLRCNHALSHHPSNYPIDKRSKLQES